MKLQACQSKPPDAKPVESTKFEIREGWSARLVERPQGPAASDAILTDLILVDAMGTERLLAKDTIGAKELTGAGEVEVSTPVKTYRVRVPEPELPG